MSKAVLVVYSAPSSPDREDEYNKWYDHTHLPQVLDVPGVTGARRFHIGDQAAAVPGGATLPPYLAIYDMDSDDPAGCFAEIVRRSQTGVIEMSSALQLDPPPLTALYTAR